MRRIESIAREVSPCNLAIEVGCDHGLISEYILQNGLAKKLIASDISQPSLEKARQLLSRFESRAELRAGDGLSIVKDNERIDAVIIAGMGGREIISILENGKRHLGQNTALVLSPHRDARLVREYLMQNNYALKTDYCMEENGIFYDIMCANRGAMILSDLELDHGRLSLLAPNEAFMRRLEKEKGNLIDKLSENNAEILQIKLEKISKLISELLAKNNK